MSVTMSAAALEERPVRAACAEGYSISPWREALVALQKYAADSPEVSFGSGGLSVQAGVRQEFYGLVDAVQRALVREVAPQVVEQLEALALRLAVVRSDVEQGAGLGAFRLASVLENLMEDAELTLAKPVFGSVLDAAAGRVDADELYALALGACPDYGRTLWRNAYEAWAYLGIVQALRPTRFWAVFSPDTVEVTAVPTDVVAVGAQVTSPERRMPEAVFQTADGRCFAMKTEVARELDFYSSRITRRRDFSAGGNTTDQIAHRVLLLYQLESPEKVGLVADRDTLRIQPPSLLCEVLEPREMETPSFVSQFVARINAVRSSRPVQVLTYSTEGEFPAGMEEDHTVAPVQRRVLGEDPEVLRAVAGLLDQ